MNITGSDIKKDFIKYTLANILGMIGLSCYILADTFFIARGTGSIGLAALNIALPYYNFFNGLAMLAGIGGATYFSLHRSRTIFTQCLYLLTLFVIPVFIVGVFFTDSLSIFMGANEETLSLTSVYLRTLSLFSPMFMLNALMSAFIRNDGSPELSMAGMLTASLSNVIMDYILIFPCNLGLFGAALATGIAPIASMSVMSWHFIKKKNTFHLQKGLPILKEWKRVISLGLFAFVTECASGISILLFNFLILPLEGNTGIAAYGVIANCALVIIYIFTGISQGMQPVVSKSIGYGRKKDALRVRKYAVITSLGLSILVYLFVFLGTDQITQIFNNQNDMKMASIAHNGMRLYFTSIFLSGINIVMVAYFSAIGNGSTAFILSVLRGVVLLAPIAFIMSWLCGMTGIWISLTVTELLVLVIVLFIIHRCCIPFYTGNNLDEM